MKSTHYKKIDSEDTESPTYEKNNGSSINSNSNSNKEDDYNSNEVVVKIKNGEDPVFTLTMKQEDTVQKLKHSILAHKKLEFDYHVRMILNGRMLQDHLTVSQSKILNNSVIICMITDPLPTISKPTTAVIPPPTTTNTSTSIPPPSTDPDPESLNQQAILEILREEGREDLWQNSIQQQQQQQQQNEQQQNEHQFYNNTNNGFEMIPVAAARDSIELLVGMIFGFVFGPLALFWVAREYIPRNTKLGIFMGIVFGLLLSIIKLTRANNMILG
ncbi:hypothetical protein CYY_004669 [Polysphondylium violaceum]|uniref:Ubiquitin-like domain-containing protein n=1 Tax=Polysphondylium violaceum TaxID=133409 RepID=A0A8J4PUA0_9MYCE|nr:hypothetical protein CYY_004669 [Polysphondylium violaceum]